MGKVLFVFGVLLVLTECLSYVSPWPSVMEHYRLITLMSEPYVKVVDGNGTSITEVIPLLFGIVLAVLGLVVMKSEIGKRQ